MESINACFISYRHTNPDTHKFFEAFTKQLEKQLGRVLPNYAKPYYDSALHAGDLYNQELAFQLCYSACMVIFFDTCYFDVNRPYCALEYHAMLQIEEQRLAQGVEGLPNTGLIFPVVYRGLDHLPKEIKDKRQYIDFQHLIDERDFKKRDCLIRLNELADQISRCYLALLKAQKIEHSLCKEYVFPQVEKIMPWLESVSPLPAMPGH
ncbi:MAG: hypothetical protein AB7E77_08710 [Desulfobulbus sp.]